MVICTIGFFLYFKWLFLIRYKLTSKLRKGGSLKMELPQDLRTAVDEELSSLSPKRLAALASELSDRYRTDEPSSGKSFLKSREDVDAYAAFRLPATFAAVYSALKQVQERLPTWKPQTIMDVGAGPGTAMWAAAEVWPDLKSITLLEREEGMIALGKRLAAHSTSNSIQEAKWIKTDITGNWEVSSHDIVIASYVFGELNEQHREAFIHKLWQAATDSLIVIEPGTPAGFSRIKQAREQLIAEGAVTIAPCPHSESCPMAGDNWCHFSQRVSRSRLHRQVKSGELSYEDEKFSFIAVSRMNGESIPGRILRHPQVRKGHIQFESCTPEGLTNTVITRKDKELYRLAKDLIWGSVLPPRE
jgi:ribosomal protein RSM22 (predicted rRNA methylase)